METKKCVKCEEAKSLLEFSKANTKKDGLSYVCKKCHSNYRREHYLKNKGKVKKQVNDYKKNNPEKYIYTSTEPNQPNKKAGRIHKSECCICSGLTYSTKLDIKNKVRKFCSKECRSSLKKSTYHHYLTGVKKRATKKGLAFNLTEEFLKDLMENKQNGLCAVSNSPIRVKYVAENTTIFDTASLDRIDSNGGYTKDNVQWVMLGINYMKMKFSNEELHKTLKLIKENYK